MTYPINTMLLLVGSGKENIVEKINGELKQKFIDPPEVSDKVLPDDFFAYAYLSKKLEFRKEFEAFDKPITFKGSEIQSFGIDQKKDSQLLSQVEVFDERRPHTRFFRCELGRSFYAYGMY